MTKAIVFSFGAILLLSLSVSAQIEGDITDEKENPIPNATVTATDSAGKIVATVKSGERGFYAFRKLARGKYKIEAKAPGYKPAVFEHVEVTVEPGTYDEMDDVRPGPRLDIVLTPESPKRNPTANFSRTPPRLFLVNPLT